MTGLFFCLASAEDAGLLFCSATIQPHTNVYSTFCACPCNFNSQHSKTAHKALQWLFLRLHPFNRQRYQTDTNGYNTACATLEHAHAPKRTAPIPDTTETPGRCTAQRRPPIIIMYIRVQRCAPVMDPCQTVQHIADHASPAGQSGNSTAGGAELLTATAVALFGLSPDSQ